MLKHVLVLIALILLVAPNPALAQFVPCDGVGINGGIPCDACYLIEMGQRILFWLIGILTVVFGFVALAAGWEMVTSGGNPAALSSAKQKLLNAVIGLLLVLAAWLLVDILMRSLLAGAGGTIPGYGPWNSVRCGSMTAAAVVTPTYGSIDLEPVGCADATCSAESTDCAALGGTPVVTVGPPSFMSCTNLSVGVASTTATVAAAGGACDESNFTTVSFRGRSVYVHNAIAGPLANVESCIAGNASANAYNIRSIGTYNCRAVTGGGGYSVHAYAAALDINPAQNGYGPKVSPCPSDMPAAFVNCFRSNGFGWGGAWRSVCDAMHFSGARREGGSHLDI